MPHEMKLATEVQIHNTLKERLKALYDLEEDDPVLLDTLEGATSLNSVIIAILREARYAGAQAEGVKLIRADMEIRQKRLERREEYLRGQASWAMDEAGLSRLDAPDMTVTTRPGKPKLIIDEERLSMDFKKAKWSADRAFIQASIDKGEVPEGVEIANGGTILTVRSK